MLVLGKENDRAKKNEMFITILLHLDFRNQPAVRKSRQLVFHKKGKFEEMANRQRAKEKLEKLQQEIAQIAKRTGIAVDNKVTIIQPKKFFVSFFQNFSFR